MNELSTNNGLSKKNFILMNIWAVLKSLKNNYEAKKTFVVHEQVKNIIAKEYEHFLKVWNKFELKTMKDYHDLYLKCDVLLLADVFEKFRNNNLKNYELCPIHYMRTPALSWDAMLNVTKLSLSLFQILTSTYSFKKVWKVEFLIFLIDIIKPAWVFEILWPKTKLRTYFILRHK